MKIANVSVIGNQIMIDNIEPITSGTVGATIDLAFSSEWEKLSKTAVFKAGNVVKDVANVDGIVAIPWEVLEKPNRQLYIGVKGFNEEGTLVIPTVYGFINNISAGTVPSNAEAQPPTPSTIDQIQAQVDNAESMAQEVLDAYKNGELNGKDYEHSEEFSRLAEQVRTDAITASSKATQAAASEQSASGSASSASSSARQAETAAGTAVSAQAAAAQSASDAQAAQKTAQETAQGITGQAERAETAASTATSKAQAAAGSAEEAGNDAANAAQSAEAAKGHADRAATEVGKIGTSVEDAQTAATTATQAAERAKVEADRAKREADTANAEKTLVVRITKKDGSYTASRSYDDIFNAENVRLRYEGAEYLPLEVRPTPIGSAYAFGHVDVKDGICKLSEFLISRGMPPYEPETNVQYSERETKANGQGGTTDHSQLTNRDAENQHPMKAITGLETALGNKLDATALPSAIETALAQAKASGQFDGKDGKTPEKGTDYFTDADKKELVGDVLAALPTARGVDF